MFADRATAQGIGLGVLTMPETLDYSVVNPGRSTLWLAARAEGIGVGWVSILDPKRMAAILDVPGDWVFIGYLCIGYPQEPPTTGPALEREGWERRQAPRPPSSTADTPHVCRHTSPEGRGMASCEGRGPDAALDPGAGKRHSSRWGLRLRDRPGRKREGGASMRKALLILGSAGLLAACLSRFPRRDAGAGMEGLPAHRLLQRVQARISAAASASTSAPAPAASAAGAMSCVWGPYVRVLPRGARIINR